MIRLFCAFLISGTLLFSPLKANAQGAVSMVGSVIGSLAIGVAVNEAISKSNEGPCANPDTAGYACPLMIGFAGAAVIAGASMLDASKKQPKLGGPDNLNKNLFGDPSNPTVEIDGRQVPVTQIMAGAESRIAALEKQGYKLDRKTGEVTTPKGKKIPPSALKSGSAMAKAGLISSPSEIELVDEQLKKASALANTKTRALAGQIGSAGAGSKRASGSGADFGMNFGAGYGEAGVKPNAPKTSGMSVLFAGEPVGAASGSLFGQIAEAYRKKREDGEFINESGGVRSTAGGVDQRASGFEKNR